MRLDPASNHQYRSRPLIIRLRLLSLKIFLVLSLAFPLLVLLAAYTLNPDDFSTYLFDFLVFMRDGFLSVLGFPVVGYAIGVILSLTYARVVVPKWSSLKRRFTVRQSGDELSDIRVETHRLTQKQFDPRDYYQAGQFFFGLDANNHPVYERDEDWKNAQSTLCGTHTNRKGSASWCATRSSYSPSLYGHLY